MRAQQESIGEKEPLTEGAGDFQEGQESIGKDAGKTSKLPLIAGLSFLIIIIISGALIYNKMRSSSSTEEKDILKLKPYIINSRRKGYSKQQITQTLLKRGWNSKIIEKAFKFK